jgi:hypothetical protein
MKKLSLFCIVLILYVCLVGVASGQMGMRNAPPAFAGRWHPVAGSGAVYEVVSTGNPKRTMEFAVLGKDSAGGKDGVWIEMTMTMPTGEMVIKELVAFDASAMTMQALRVIMQMPGRPPMEMPDTMVQMRQPINYSDIVGKSEDVGSESVTTPAGTFSCEHYRAKDGSGDGWVSDKVVPFGLVKHQGKDQTTTLVKTFTDAKDKITGTPQAFDPMKMMPQQPPQPQP